MGTVELTETYVGATITGGAVLSGTGLRWGLYSATKATASDWIVFGDFTTVYFAQACTNIDTNGSVESCNISVTTANLVQLGGAAVGAEYYLVMGV